ncbi:hypothetical protein SAMN04489762_1070 [Terribacillus saccharophilus]|uniref:YwpF-like protein n=1 Tax=Terribacillus saccharophilus TaxID=361277 RepID=A0AAX2ED92_9BACI|nr:hypothetical protein SAMN04489762_1070 [Terribacillus saccharophilus]
MEHKQLEGRLLLDPGAEIIFLRHEVCGRISEMELSEEDRFILLTGDKGHHPVKIDDLFDRPEPGSKRCMRIILKEAYRYQGAKVKVTLNTNETLLLNSVFIKRYVRNVMDHVQSGHIEMEEALELIDNLDDIGRSFE